MNGTQPSAHIIVRNFRGQQLVLSGYGPRGCFHWTRDRDKALKLSHGQALGLADKAAREYGAACATLAVDGSMSEPAAARSVAVLVPSQFASAVAAYNAARERGVESAIAAPRKSMPAKVHEFARGRALKAGE